MLLKRALVMALWLLLVTPLLDRSAAGFAQELGNAKPPKSDQSNSPGSDSKSSPTAEDGAESKKPTDKESGNESDDTSQDDKKSPGRIAAIEKKIDKAAGWVVGKLFDVMFYQFGKGSFSAQLEAKSVDVETVRNLLENIESKGASLTEVDLTLSIPANLMTEDEAKEFAKSLKAEFIVGSRKFTVTLRKPTDKKPSGNLIVLEANRHGMPLVVLWLIFGATFFTLRMGFINFRGFKHAILVTAGKFDNPEDAGEVTHFQALTSALSATVGLGNIAGVAIAVSVGGPGATFWMIVAGILGMTSKFTECTLGQMYREVRPDGRIMGGAMYYLSNGLKDMGLGGLGKVLAVMFAILCVGGSLGGGNAFQVNQALNAVEATVPVLGEYKWVFGVVMCFFVGIVIIGGIRRIAVTAEKIVPLMCGVYVLACLWILLVKFNAIPNAFGIIFSEAFTPKAGYGAFIGVLVTAFQRAAFSNEAGVGSAAIAHSAAKTDYPAREGIVALLGPFIDTVVICTMTALVIVITGAYDNPVHAELVASKNGAALTSEAMGEVIWWFPYVLSVAVILFAYSTMISWSYYGERCWAYLFGDRATMTYRIIFLIFVVLGSIVSSTNILDLSDLMILGMAFPNILGLLLLSGKVRRHLDDYWGKYKAGEFKRKT